MYKENFATFLFTCKLDYWLLHSTKLKRYQSAAYIDNKNRRVVKTSVHMKRQQLNILRLSVPRNWPRTVDEVLRNPWKNAVELEDAGVLLDSIKKHTPPPKYVMELAENYIRSTLSSNRFYLAMHWRYDHKVNHWYYTTKREPEANYWSLIH